MKLRTWVLRTSLVLLVALTGARTVAETASAADEIIDLSGYGQTLVSLPWGLANEVAGTVNSAPGVTTEQRDLIANSVIDDFDVAGTRAALVAQIEEGLSAEQQNEILGWYRSELGRRFSAAEIAANDPEVRAEKGREGHRLAQDDVRQPHVRANYMAGRGIDFGVQFEFTESLANMYTMFTAMGGQVTLENLRAQLAPQVGAAREMVRLRLESEQAYAMRDFTIEEIDAYTEFLADEPFQIYAGLVLDNLTEAQNSMIERIATRWPEFLQR